MKKTEITTILLLAFLFIGLFQFSIPKASASSITVHIYSTSSEEGLEMWSSYGITWFPYGLFSNQQVYYGYDYGDMVFTGERYFEYFNTSSIPQSAIITSVKLHLYAKEYNPEGVGNISAQQGTQATPLSTSDWTSFSGSTYGFVNVTSSTYANYTITFNSQGINNIVEGGITKICLREYALDCLSLPSWYILGIVWSGEPYLEITYSLPVSSVGGISAPLPMFSLIAPWLSAVLLLAAAILLKGFITRKKKKD